MLVAGTSTLGYNGITSAFVAIRMASMDLRTAVDAPQAIHSGRQMLVAGATACMQLGMPQRFTTKPHHLLVAFATGVIVTWGSIQVTGTNVTATRPAGVTSTLVCSTTISASVATRTGGMVPKAGVTARLATLRDHQTLADGVTASINETQILDGDGSTAVATRKLTIISAIIEAAEPGAGAVPVQSKQGAARALTAACIAKMASIRPRGGTDGAHPPRALVQ